MEAVATKVDTDTKTFSAYTQQNSELIEKINSSSKSKAMPRSFMREFGHLPNYTEWPELVGKSVTEAIEVIWSDRPDIEVWSLPVTRKVSSLGAPNRVILYYDEYKLVTNPMPHVG